MPEGAARMQLRSPSAILAALAESAQILEHRPTARVEPAVLIRAGVT
jgi:hypothetical protein